MIWYSKSLLKGMPDTWEEWTPIFIALATAFVLQRFVHYLFRHTAGWHDANRQNYTLIKHCLYALIYTAATIVVVYNIPPFRQIALSLLASAGVLALFLGLSAQHAFTNIVSGLFIIMFRPFKVGDMIEIGEQQVGIVEDITLRHTIIRNFENRRIIVPNSVISQEVIVNSNITDARICKHYNINISLDSDIDTAMNILQCEAERHPLCIDHRVEEEKEQNQPIVEVKVIGFNNHSINLRAWIWAANTSDAFEMACSLNVIIKKRFDTEGIRLALPHYIVSAEPQGWATRTSSNLDSLTTSLPPHFWQ